MLGIFNYQQEDPCDWSGKGGERVIGERPWKQSSSGSTASCEQFEVRSQGSGEALGEF